MAIKWSGRESGPGTFWRKKVTFPAFVVIWLGSKRSPSVAVMLIGIAPAGAADAFAMVDASGGGDEVAAHAVGEGPTATALGEGCVAGEGCDVGAVDAAAVVEPAGLACPAGLQPPIASAAATTRKVCHRFIEVEPPFLMRGRAPTVGPTDRHHARPISRPQRWTPNEVTDWKQREQGPRAPFPAGGSSRWRAVRA
jgi:hypothetical protein